MAEPDIGQAGGSGKFKDLTRVLWSSIDNDDSRDLDQLEYIEAGSEVTRLYIAIADVRAFVAQNSALDAAAQHNTTSIYTGVRTFPMLPERLSTDLTSLLENQTRLAVVVEMHFAVNGDLNESSVYRAIVRDHAQLTYRAVGAWFEEKADGLTPISARVRAKIEASTDIQHQLRQQHELAEVLRQRRKELGALSLETIEARPEMSSEGEWELGPATRNTATRLIEDFMIAANKSTIGFLQQHHLSALRRVVRIPKDWPQIVKLAAAHGEKLPPTPDPVALDTFLTHQRRKDPDRFPDLSLAVIKLLGRGEYVVAGPDGVAPGHFGLAVESYGHTTAPNRRYPDVITQRLVCAALAKQAQPYSQDELSALAQHCTEKENDAKKAERSVHKSIAAASMVRRIGEQFEGMITGASEKGVWARLLRPPVEGRLHGATGGLAVGDRVRVKLVLADPWRGFIDFDILERLPRRSFGR